MKSAAAAASFILLLLHSCELARSAESLHFPPASLLSLWVAFKWTFIHFIWPVLTRAPVGQAAASVGQVFKRGPLLYEERVKERLGGRDGGRKGGAAAK